MSRKDESKQYPIGGYAPGNYMCNCSTCKKQFIGDKRAVQCEPCAIEMTKKETFEEYLQRLKDRRTEDNYKYTDEDFENYIHHIFDCYEKNISVYKCLEFMYFIEREVKFEDVFNDNKKEGIKNLISKHKEKLMEEEIKALLNEMESKINPEFDFEFEHWDNGNYDDSYEYGVEVGEEYTYREIVAKLKEILKKK